MLVMIVIMQETSTVNTNEIEEFIKLAKSIKEEVAKATGALGDDGKILEAMVAIERHLEVLSQQSFPEWLNAPLSKLRERMLNVKTMIRLHCSSAQFCQQAQRVLSKIEFPAAILHELSSCSNGMFSSSLCVSERMLN